MSGVIVIRSLLANNANLTAAVPAANIMAGVIPLNTALPAIGITQISGRPILTVAMTESRLSIDRVQVTIMAPTYALQKSILNLVRAACPNTHGSVNGVVCDSILPDTEGPDFSDYEIGAYFQSVDFFVKYSA